MKLRRAEPILSKLSGIESKFCCLCDTLSRPCRDVIKSGDLSQYPFVRIKDNIILLSVYIQPNADQSAIVGVHDTRLKIKIAALPVGGQANKALCDFVAKHFAIPKKSVTIISGLHAHKKLLKIEI